MHLIPRWETRPHDYIIVYDGTDMIRKTFIGIVDKHDHVFDVVVALEGGVFIYDNVGETYNILPTDIIYKLTTTEAMLYTEFN